ncbi:hypothetical protein HYS48_00325 [Candidatus Woesearchaeota archaeon]|nr:hypothetical protein [Candidatus Woesearchaeota archaeon]
MKCVKAVGFLLFLFLSLVSAVLALECPDPAIPQDLDPDAERYIIQNLETFEDAGFLNPQDTFTEDDTIYARFHVIDQFAGEPYDGEPVSESASIGGPADKLEINERIGDILETVTEAFMPKLLKSYSKTTDQGTTAVKQFLRFEEGATDEWVNIGTIPSGKITFDEDEDDIVNHYLFFKDGDIMSEYELEFEAGLKSKVEDDKLPDLEGKTLHILGESYLIKSTAIDTATKTVKLTLYDGFNTVVWEDNDYEDNQYDTDGVTVNDVLVDDALVNIVGSLNGSIFAIISVQYRLKADALKGHVYIRPGHGLREFLDEPQGMLNNNWDIVYEGLQDTGVSILKIDSSGDDSYSLKFTSREGLDYIVPLMDNSNDAGEGFKYGDEDDEWYFRECYEKDSDKVQGPNPIYCIQEDDGFYLTNEHSPTGKTHVLVFEHLDTDKKEIFFTDLGLGQVEMTYDESVRIPEVGGLLGIGYLEFGADRYLVAVGNRTNNFSLAIDLNANGKIDDDDRVKIVIEGGGMVDLGMQCTNALLKQSGRPISSEDNEACPYQDATSINMTLTTLRSEFDEAGPFNVNIDEIITINITKRAINEIDLNVLNAYLCINAAGAFTYHSVPGIVNCAAGYKLFEVMRIQSLQDEDIRQGLSTYGVFFEQTDEDDQNDADELTVEYPLEQRGGIAKVTLDINQDYSTGAKLIAGGGQELSMNFIDAKDGCYFYSLNTDSIDPAFIGTDTVFSYFDYSPKGSEGEKAITINSQSQPGGGNPGGGAGRGSGGGGAAGRGTTGGIAGTGSTGSSAASAASAGTSSAGSASASASSQSGSTGSSAGPSTGATATGASTAFQAGTTGSGFGAITGAFLGFVSENLFVFTALAVLLMMSIITLIVLLATRRRKQEIYAPIKFGEQKI